MPFTAFCGFGLLVVFNVVVSQDSSNQQCPTGQVHCRERGPCVPRFEFTCGQKTCGKNKTLCGPPEGNPLNCVSGRRCPARNSSLPPSGVRSPIPGGRRNDSSPGFQRGEGRRHVSREDSHGNPFLSRQSADNGDGSGGGNLMRVLNETRLRRMLRRSFNHSIFNGAEDRRNGSSGDSKDPNEDRCGRRYSPCVQNPLRNFMLLKSLNRKCCKIRENPRRFARQLWNISREYGCPKGTKFCPFRFVFTGEGCIPVGRNCTAGFGNRSDDRNSSERHWSPWGTKSRKGFKYCEIVKADIPSKMPCSYPAVIKWMAAKNESDDSLRKACPPGKNLCRSTFECRPKDQGCSTRELIRWASKIFCGPSKRLCVGCEIRCLEKEESCPRGANMSVALRNAALSLEPGRIGNESLRNLTKSGWAPFCLLSNALLSSTLKALNHCLSLEAHCRDSGYEEHMNCVQGSEFCQKLDSFAQPFASQTHDNCRLLRTNPAKFEEKIRANWTTKPWRGKCRNGTVFCPLSMRCVPKDHLSECSPDQQVFLNGLKRPPWKMDQSRKAGDRFCFLFMSPAPNGSCSFSAMLQWLARRNKSCSPVAKCWRGGGNFSQTKMDCVTPKDRKDLWSELNETKCDDDDGNGAQVFCRHRHVCLPKHANCTRPEKFNFFSVSQFANRSGYAALCQVHVPLAEILECGRKQCKRFLNRANGTCRAKTSCQEREEFCRPLGRCIPLGKCRSSRPLTPPLCNRSDPEFRMLWAGEPLKKLFAPNQEVPALVGLLAAKGDGVDLRFKSLNGDWKGHKGCGRGKMRVLSTDSILRLSSCAHGFLSFEIISSPGGSSREQCVNIPTSPRFRETVGMAVLPKLDHCTAGLDITVIRPRIFTHEGRPPINEPFSTFVRVVSNPANCSVLKVNESLSCRVPEAFRLRYRQALKRLQGKQLGLVVKDTDPPKQVGLKCFSPQSSKAVDVPVRCFFRAKQSCTFYPLLNSNGRVTLTVVPACQAPAPQDPNFSAAKEEDLRKIYEIYNSLPALLKKGDSERIIEEIVRRLNVAGHSTLRRKIRNFVRSLASLANLGRKESCTASNNTECSLGTKEGKLTVVIQRVNQRPTLHLAKDQDYVHFPPVPENASKIERKCIDVFVLMKTSQAYMGGLIRAKKGRELFERMAAGEALTDRRTSPLAMDTDSRELGLAITEIPKQSRFGEWRFKLRGDSVLRRINISEGSVLLLKPGDCITFKAEGGFWGKKDSRDFTFFKLRAWDCSDNRTSGYHRLNATFMDSQTAFSRQVVKCVVSKLGCDDVAGSKLEIDRCGKCTRKPRDRNKCVGCDDIPYSKKEKDECGNCLDPDGEPPYCSKRCSIPSYYDECKVCQINGSEVQSKDCNGDCDGTAMWSDCFPDICVGGKTNKSINLGMDICGDCGGKNKCIDCEGVVNGKKRWDSCHRCLHRDDKSFNKCPKIIAVDVKAVNGDESTQLCVTVAGMKETIRCSLKETTGSPYNLNLLEIKSKRKVIFSTPTGIPPGKYVLGCTLDDSPNRTKLNEKILVYSRPQIFEVSSNETQVNTTSNVTVTGSGFVNTSTLQCIFITERGEIMKFKATYINQTTIICLVKFNERSQHGSISVLFNPKAKKHARAMAKRFSFYDLVPEPTKCEFSETRRYLLVIFNKEIECGNGRWKTCSSFFNSAALSKLTQMSRCLCRENKLLVQIAPDSRLRPGATVGVLLWLINRKRSGYTKHSSSEERRLNVSAKPVEFTVKLSAPDEVGLCDSFTISVVTNQRAAMNWSAAFESSSSATPAQTADLLQLNARLANVSSRQTWVWFSARDVKVGIAYNITVCGKEDFNGQEACDSIAIRRVAKTVPKIMFPTSRVVIGPSIRLKFRAKVQAPTCVTRNKRLMLYLWNCDDRGLEFDDESPTLKIGADQLAAGQVLKCGLTAYVRGDDSLRARAKLAIVVKTRNVVAKIKGGEQRVISAHNETVCDGSGSFDPNNLPGDPIFLWTCKCKQDDGWKPCIHRNKTSGRLKLVILPRKQILRIPPDTFPSNKMCAVTLTYFKGDMNASTSVYFDVKEQEVPFVKIIKVTTRGEKVVFIAVVKSPLPDLKIEWSCKQKDKEGNLLEFDLGPAAVTRFSLILKKRRDKLVMKRRLALIFKTLQDGLRVKCKCSVSREEVEAYAEDELKVDLPPIEGKCQGVERSENGGISIQADDFEDPEGEVMQYRCGYVKRNGKPEFITSWSTSTTCENVDLPSGDPASGHEVQCIVQARNTRGATVRTLCPVVVLPQNVSSEDMENATEAIGEKLNQNKMPELRGQLEKMLRGSNDKEAKEKMLNTLTTAVADQVKKVVENEYELSDDENKNENLKTLNLGLHGVEEEGVDEDDQRVEEARKRSEALEDVEGLAQDLKKMNSPKRKESDSDSRRKRRAAGDGGEEEGEVAPKTTEEIETTLSIYTALIQPSNFSNSSMAVKKILVEVVDDLGRGLCQSLSTGEPALVAESHIVVIRTEKNSFDTIDVNFTNVACENCSYTVQASAQVLLGQSLKDLYESWDCDEDGCNGACVVSAQYPHDLLATYDNGTSISDVVYVKLFNPENAAPLSASGLTEPATFRIPLQNYNSSNDTVPACHVWDESSLTWKADGVITTVISNSGSRARFVDCRSSRLGFLTVFAASSSVIPGESSTTQLPPVLTEEGTPEKQVNFQFKLVGNYDDFITGSSISEFKSKVTEAIAVSIGVLTSRITDFHARRGSILVSFILLPGGPGETTVLMAESLLRELVTSGNFSVTFADGRTLVADSTSFQSSVTPFTTPMHMPTTENEKGPTEAYSKLSTVALVGIIVGSLLGLVLFIISVVVIANRRSKFSKVNYTSPIDDQNKQPFSPPPGHENRVFFEEMPQAERNSSEYPMVDLREEVDTPLPGTPCYDETGEKMSRA